MDDSPWCSASLRDNEQLLIGLVYRSPSSSDDNNCRLISAIRGINDLNIFSQVLLFGDFNSPGINWEDLDYAGSETSLAACLLDAINDAYLFQHVTGFTRHRCGQRSSLLDLVFTLDTNSIQFVQHHSPLCSSDHKCLTWQYKCLLDNNPTTEHQSKIYNYWKGNYLSMCEEFNEIDWELLFSSDNIELNWSLFKEKVTSAMDKHIPKVTKKVPSNKPPWWSNALASAIKKKQQLYSTFRHTRLSSDYVTYTSKRMKSRLR